MSFIMPSRRSTTNLLQASGELWSEGAEQAPLQVIVLTPGPPTDARVEAVVSAATQLAPDDVALHRVEIDALPPFGPDPTGGPEADALQRFRDDIAVADCFLLVAAADDGNVQRTLVHALRWAATPAGEDALTGVPVVWLGLGGDPDLRTSVRLLVQAAVEAGGGVMPDDAAVLAAPLAGDWTSRLGPTGRLDDVTTRQAIGQVLIRLRQIAYSGEDDIPATEEETPG